MQATNSSSQVENGRLSLGRVAVAGLVAAIAAAVANAVVYVVAAALGAFPDSVLIQPAGQPMSLGPVISASVAGAIGAAVVFALVGRFFRRPARTFVLLSAVVFAISLAPPFTVAGATAGFVAALLVMHVVAAVIIVGVLVAAANKT